MKINVFKKESLPVKSEKDLERRKVREKETSYSTNPIRRWQKPIQEYTEKNGTEDIHLRAIKKVDSADWGTQREKWIDGIWIKVLNRKITELEKPDFINTSACKYLWICSKFLIVTQNSNWMHTQLQFNFLKQIH